MPRLKLWPLAIVLAAGFLLSVAMCARAETMQTVSLCQPSHVTVAALRSYGLEVVDVWVGDDGFPVELWSDGRDGRAIVLLAQADNGALLRCLIASHTPSGQLKS